MKLRKWIFLLLHSVPIEGVVFRGRQDWVANDEIASNCIPEAACWLVSNAGS
jgi:hypothetical protein